MPHDGTRKRKAGGTSASVLEWPPFEFDATDEARRRWQKRGWPTSEAMAAAVSIMHAGRMVRASLDKTLEACGLSYSQYEVLGVLSFSHESRLPMSRLSTHLRLHPASITNTVDRLCERDWVRRVIDPADRRMVYVELTPEGDAIVKAATEAIGATNFGMGDLSVRQLNMLTSIVRQLRLAYGLLVNKG